MAKSIIDSVNKLLQNITGKKVEGKYNQLVDLIDAYNEKFVVEVKPKATIVKEQIKK